MNSYEQNITTRPLTDSDLILDYGDEYTTMYFRGKINNGLLSIVLDIENSVDWHITLTFTNGRFISVDDNDTNVDDWNDTKRLINIYGIACGMKYLHSNLILHRDLKPANILLDAFLYPKITDFGFSRPYNQINKISEHETAIVGTYQYISPEIFEYNDYSCASDVYAFAFIVYEIITGEKPLRQFNNIYQIMNKVGNENYRPPFELPILKCYKELIGKCWDVNKKNRPTFEEIVQQLKTNPEFIKYYRQCR